MKDCEHCNAEIPPLRSALRDVVPMIERLIEDGRATTDSEAQWLTLWLEKVDRALYPPTPAKHSTECGPPTPTPKTGGGT